MAAEKKNLGEPDDVVRFPHLLQNSVDLGDLTVAHTVLEPSWRWSVDVRPSVGGEWCQARHVGTVISGSFGVSFPNGARMELHAGDVYDIPPGHDGYALGEEPCEIIEWAGIRAFSGFRAGVKGRQLVTLMFTDVVESTSIANRLGDIAWREMLSSHFESARALFENYGGREVNTTGDGMLATFDATAPALNCAVELSRKAKRDDLHIRVGVHVGEVEAVGDDIRGVAVHEAARIMGAAGSDEVLVSETARALALTAGFTFEDRGMHELKGLGNTRLFALNAPTRDAS